MRKSDEYLWMGMGAVIGFLIAFSLSFILLDIKYTKLLKETETRNKAELIEVVEVVAINSCIQGKLAILRETDDNPIPCDTIKNEWVETFKPIDK